MIPKTKVAKSIWLRANYPSNQSSKARRASICGYGVNDADYVVSPLINGNREPCAAYTTWRSMIQRCVDAEYKERRPAYKDVSVCDEWLSFMAFRRWWLVSYVEGWEIDKDLLSSGAKIYGPDTCLFVPEWLNLFLKDTADSSGLPKGVIFEASRGKFKASVKHLNKTFNIGRYGTADEARAARVAAKVAIAESRKWEIDTIAPWLFDRVISLIKEGR